MKRRIIRLSSETSTNYLDIMEEPNKLLIMACFPGSNTTANFSLEHKDIEELLEAIQTLRPAKPKEIKK